VPIKPSQEFRKKRDEWRALLSVADGPSLESEIRVLLLDSLRFHAASEAWKLDVATGAGAGRSLNFEFIDVFDRGFIASQSMRIRRLVDKRKGMVSLRKIVDDVRSNRQIITRANYVCCDGLPYESNDREDTQECPCDGWEGSHIVFDAAAGSDASNRDPCDRIAESLLDGLKQELNPCCDLREAVNKVIANTARPPYPDELHRIPNTNVHELLKKCCAGICRVYSFLCLFVSRQNLGSLVPTHVFDQFENLDKTIAVHTSTEDLRDAWNRRVAEVELWNMSDSGRWRDFAAHMISTVNPRRAAAKRERS
jgi:hypothetical protein